MAFEPKRNLRPPPAVPMRTVVAKDEETQRVQRNVQEATESARSNPLNASRVVTIKVRPPDGSPTDKGEPISWPIVNVSHGLGRAPSSWQQEARSGTGDVALRDATQLELFPLKVGASSDRTSHSNRLLRLYATGTIGGAPNSFKLRIR
jgi:hypothetical protein